MSYKPAFKKDAPAFDEDSNPIDVVQFDDGETPPSETVSASARAELIKRLLGMITSGATTTKQAGQRAILLAYLVQAGDCKTQKELAKRLGVTPGRVSQALNSIKLEIAMLSAENEGC